MYSNKTKIAKKIILGLGIATTMTQLSLGAVLAGSSPFSIKYNFTDNLFGENGNAYSAEFRQLFENAKTEWETVLADGYLNGNVFIPPTGPSSGPLATELLNEIEIFVVYSTSTSYASAATTEFRADSEYVLASEGRIRFNSGITVDSSTSQASKDDLQATIIHEIGHVLGIGSDLIWGRNNLYDPDTPSVTDPLTGEQVGQYLGPNALAAYQTEFGQTGATFVPVEKTANGGSAADGHWNQLDNPFADTGAVSSINGIDFRHELMTFAGNDQIFLSSVTLGALRDMGFNVTINPVPEPSSLTLISACGLLIFRRRRE